MKRRFVAIVFLTLATVMRARADTVVIVTGPSPVLNVQMTGGKVTIRTWNRPQIRIDAQGTVNWQHYGADQVAGQIPAQFSILSQTAITAQGPMTLPAEVWVLPPLPAQPHDGLVVTGNGDTTITVPASSALVAARIIMQGSISLRDYNGAFFTFVHTGNISLNNVSGNGFAQVVRGSILALNSSFDSFRARTVAGSVFFEGVDASQIRVSSAHGSIVYDNGSFQPGVARFESQYGNIALGVASGSAQIGAHSDTGHVVTSFNDARNVTRTANLTDANATFGEGGPTVTANTNHGTVILYDGHITDHSTLTQRFPGISKFQQRVVERSANPAPPGPNSGTPRRKLLQQKFPQNHNI